MEIIPPISALRAWDAYEYQGHISLYITLEKICNLISCNKDVNEYKLHIESIEDFSLLEGDDYISIHQVKIGKVNLTESDKFSFLVSLIEHNNAKGYFHINETERIPTDFCSVTAKYIDNLKKELQKEIVDKNDSYNENNKDGYIICEEISSNTKKGNLYGIIKFVVNGFGCHEYTKENVKRAIETIEDELNSASEIIKDKCDDSQYLEVYDKRFDDGIKVQEESYKLIKRIIQQEKKEYMIFVNDEYLKCLYQLLYASIKDAITICSSNKDIHNCFISFKDILDFIKENKTDALNTKEFQYYKILNLILKNMDMYREENDSKCEVDKCENCDELHNCNLKQQIIKLMKLDVEDYKKTMHNLLLYEPNCDNINNLPNDSLISCLMFDVLIKAKNMSLVNNVFQTIKDGTDIYRLTLDDSKKTCHLQNKIQKFIIDDNDRSILYETDVLITGNLDGENLLFNEERVNVLGERELNELNDNNISTTSIEAIKRDFNKPKVIRVINDKKAIEELS